jgi:hypothetical protein
MRPALRPDAVMPFDAAPGTILYSAERKLAIVDGRIVGIGDDVVERGWVDITQAMVLLRDAQGASASVGPCGWCPLTLLSVGLATPWR